MGLVVPVRIEDPSSGGARLLIEDADLSTGNQQVTRLLLRALPILWSYMRDIVGGTRGY